jgi:hypothetical protein
MAAQLCCNEHAAISEDMEGEILVICNVPVSTWVSVVSKMLALHLGIQHRRELVSRMSRLDGVKDLSAGK